MYIRNGRGEMLVSMLYRSRATERFRESELSNLVAGARQHNRQNRVTGALFYDDGKFLQWLEGPRNSVEDLFTAIAGDPRHTSVEVVSVGTATSRVFADWDLRLLQRQQNEQNSLRVVRPCSSCNMPACLTEEIALKLASGDSGDFRDALGAEAGRTNIQVCFGERIADRYAEMWANDTISTAESLAGQAIALSAFRHVVSSQSSQTLPAGNNCILVAPLPGEPYYLNAALATTMLESARLATRYLVPSTVHDLLEAVSSAEVSRVVLVSGCNLPGAAEREAIKTICDGIRSLRHPPERIVLYCNVARRQIVRPDIEGPDKLVLSALRLPDLLETDTFPTH